MPLKKIHNPISVLGKRNLSFLIIKKQLISFPVWLRNRLISAGLESALSHTEKSCIASYYKQYSTNFIKIKNIRLIPTTSYVSLDL